MSLSPFSLVAAAALFLSACASTAKGPGPLSVVDRVDVARYAGRWYEIARYQHVFEWDIVGAAAEYSLKADGTISVINSGFKKTLDGKYTSIQGTARVPDVSKPGRLKVRFFGPFEADYLIFGLDADSYSWALVGSDNRKYLWFLARTPTIDDAVFERMKTIAQAQGYSLDQLYKVPQKER